jgi:hypothetical protein
MELISFDNGRSDASPEEILGDGDRNRILAGSV